MLAVLVRGAHGVAVRHPASTAQGCSCSLGIGVPVDTARALEPMETGLAFYPQTPHTEEFSKVLLKRLELLGGKFQTKKPYILMSFQCHCTRARMDEEENDT